jgi:tight adherence protein C
MPIQWLALLLGLLLASAGAAMAITALHPPQVDGEIDAEAVLAELDRYDDDDEPVLDEFAARLHEPLMTRLFRPLGKQMAGRLSGFLPRKRIEELRHKLLVAGQSTVIGPEEFFLVQAVAAGLGLLGGLLIARLSGEAGVGAIRLVAIAVAIGVFLPVAWLRRKRDEQQASIRQDLPDILDLMAISVEAGVGFEGALEVVTRHFQSPLATELGRTLREMELGLPRREALQNLKRRTEVPELSNFVLILVQADALGMPIGRVLRTQAVEMRSKRRQWAREKAAKLPVKMLIPLTIFILPALFVVVLGPAAISLSKNL